MNPPPRASPTTTAGSTSSTRLHVWRVGVSEAGTPGGVAERRRRRDVVGSAADHTGKPGGARLHLVAAWVGPGQPVERARGARTVAGVLGTSNGGATWVAPVCGRAVRGRGRGLRRRLERHGWSATTARTTEPSHARRTVALTWILQSLRRRRWLLSGRSTCVSADHCLGRVAKAAIVLQDRRTAARRGSPTRAATFALDDVLDLHFASAQRGYAWIAGCALGFHDRCTARPTAGLTWSRVGASWNGNWHPESDDVAGRDIRVGSRGRRDRDRDDGWRQDAG